MLIINADDWGLDEATTNAIAACYERGRITSTSAMMFMDDSVRAAELAGSIDIDVGLHLNLTEPFTSGAEPQTRASQKAVAQFLQTNKLAGVILNPRLHRAFRRAVSAQLEEFRRLYGREPSHIDGHHHAHLSANVLFGCLLPADFIVRRHFTFFAGEKSWLNRTYRGLCNRILGIRCRMLDGFYDLTQHMHTPKMQRLAGLANAGVVELMVHPAEENEFSYLTGDDFGNWLRQVQITDFRSLNSRAREHPGPGNQAAV